MPPKQSSTLATPKEGGVITLEGKEYKMSPFSLKIMMLAEKEFGDNIGNMFERAPITTVTTLLHLLLRENHPDLELMNLAEMVTPAELSQVSTQLSEMVSEITKSI